MWQRLVELGYPMRYGLTLADFYYLLGITHLFPHNELVHLPYIAVATNTRADYKLKGECSGGNLAFKEVVLKGQGGGVRRVRLPLDPLPIGCTSSA